MLLTIGEDETTSPQLSAMCLKVFDLDKMQLEGSSATGPTCIQILQIFTNQFPEAKVFVMSSWNLKYFFFKYLDFIFLSLFLHLIKVSIEQIWFQMAASPCNFWMWFTLKNKFYFSLSVST